MSFLDAVGQISQIVQWEQQLTDPSALTGGASIDPAGTAAATSSAADTATATTAAGATTATIPTTATAPANATPATTATAGTQSISFADLLAQAQSPTAATATSGPSGGDATSASDPRVEAMTNEANALIGKPYVYGGGHDGWGTQTGYDCSGFVSAVLHAGGYLSTPQDTTTMPSASGLQSGPGKYVTVYDRDQPGQSGHVIIEIDGQFFESGGESGSWGGGSGVQRIATPPAAYLNSFDKVLHPTGL